MKIAFFDTKPYDHIWFDQYAEKYGCKIRYFEHKLNTDTAISTHGYDAVCVFVNDDLSKQVIEILAQNNVRLIALRCAGYNHVDLQAAQGSIEVVRVPNYSPAAVAEHTAALLLSVVRKTHRAYARTRENNFNINGLMGFDLRNRTIGIIGTGQIGVVFAEIARGFGMEVLAYDPYPKKDAGLRYTDLGELLASSDVVSLHCPLTAETRHMICKESISQMKDGVIILNTSRGALIHTDALLDGLLSHKIGGAGLDVYEEEEHYFFEDKSNDIIPDEDLTRLLSLPNVLITSHQAFFTKEAMQAIARVTMENIDAFVNGRPLENKVAAK